MFVALVRFPVIEDDHEQAFLDWFTWSNDVLNGVEGLRQRRLLRAGDGSYSAVVEHDSAATFAAMHDTETAAEVQRALRAIMDEQPQATTFEVVADLASRGSCCGGSSTAAHHYESVAG